MEKSGDQLNVSDEDESKGVTTQFVFEETTEQPKADRPHWSDETFFEENKLPGHTTFMPYANTAALQAVALTQWRMELKVDHRTQQRAQGRLLCRQR